MSILDEDSWDILLTRIEAGEIVPVIGDELIRVRVGEAERSLYSYLAERVRQELKLPDTEFRTLHDVFCQWRSSPSGKGSPERPYATLNRVYKDPVVAGAQLPAALRELAEISDFQLYVSTTFDDFLGRSLASARSASPQALAYSPVRHQDLSEEIGQLAQATVFQLMGKLASVPDDYAVTEEDYLEFMYSLQSPERRPVRLFEELGSRRLLVLGSGLCDWLVRFFLRGKSMERISRRSVGDYLVGSRVGRELEVFLGHFAPNTRVISCDPAEFVAELRRRWSERRPNLPPPSAAPEKKLPGAGSVFISYASEDRPAARALHDMLDTMGIEAWYDRDDLLAGANFDEGIRRAIQASVLFLPIISKTVLTNERRYFRQEWTWAVGELSKARRDLQYVIPIVIDDTRFDSSEIFSEFGQLSWLSAPSSRFTEELLTPVRSAYRAYYSREKSASR
jgi:hypothetical protein